MKKQQSPPIRSITPDQVRQRIAKKEMRLRPMPAAEDHEKFVSRRRMFRIRMEMLYVYMQNRHKMPVLAKYAQHYLWSKGPMTRANVHHHITVALKWVMEHAWFEERVGGK